MAKKSNPGELEFPKHLKGSAEFFRIFKSQLGFQLPADIEAVFSEAHKYLNSDDASELRKRLSPSQPGRTDWYGKLHNAVIGNCKRQASQCLYHLGNLIAWENLAIEIIRTHRSKIALAENQGMALSAEKIDYEFHALAFAIKTYVSYLAGTVFVFFKSKDVSFANFEKTLAGVEPKVVARRVEKLLKLHWERLSLYYSMDDRRSLRDTLAHYKFVGAGFINIYGGTQLAATIAMHSEILRNEVIDPAFNPAEVESTGLGISKMMNDHVSYVLTLSIEIFRTLGILDSTAGAS